ncbi:MAG: trypsin-like peptidase domain-containing protein [Deltaproteobacteria bacterium]|nr:trypsin-like peptidase domain-containing protein [Deltaproteobacteria bacterium]
MKKAIALPIFVGFLLTSSVGMATVSGPCNKPLPELFKQVSPAVVFISAISIDPFKLNNRVNTAIGSGFIFSDEGLILTNSHVVFGRQAIFVTLDDGRKYPVILLGADPIYDLAVLKIPNAPKDLHKTALGDSSKIQIGEEVVAIGNPLGLEQTLTRGVISGVNRIIQETKMTLMLPLIQTDAAINPGNSGGPLVNLCGEVIGINTAAISEAQNIGFAVPINLAKKTIPELIKEGRVIRPWVGINGKYVEKDAIAILNVPLTEGFLIETVEPGSPAQKAGLRGGALPVSIAGMEILLGGDIITHINEKTINSPEMAVKIFQSFKVGQKIAIQYIRRGKKNKANFVIPERPILPSDLH